MSLEERGPIGQGFWNRILNIKKLLDNKKPSDHGILNYVCSEDDPKEKEKEEETKPMDDGTEA